MTEEQPNEIRERVVAVPHLFWWRGMKRMTQEELAQKAGVSRATITRAEAGDRVSVQTLARLAEALGISVPRLSSEGDITMTKDEFESFGRKRERGEG